MEHSNVVKVRAQWQLENLSGWHPGVEYHDGDGDGDGDDGVADADADDDEDLYLICMVRWSRMSIELVEITNKIGTNWKINIRKIQNIKEPKIPKYQIPNTKYQLKYQIPTCHDDQQDGVKLKKKNNKHVREKRKPKQRKQGQPEKI